LGQKLLRLRLNTLDYELQPIASNGWLILTLYNICS